jgi:hypothetical protein
VPRTICHREASLPLRDQQNEQICELHFDPVLRVSQNSELAIYPLYQKQRYLVPKVKAAVDFLVARI